MSRLALCLIAASLGAQSFQPVLDSIRADQAWTLEQQISICEIPAPPFKETKRGEEWSRRMRALGFSDIRTDSEGNVISRYPGSKRAKPLIVFSAHLDTVFPEGMDVKVRKEGTQHHGLGIGDDCRGLAVVLTVAKAFQKHKVALDANVLFVATVGEEGQGDLAAARPEIRGEIRAERDEPGAPHEELQEHHRRESEADDGVECHAWRI